MTEKDNQNKNRKGRPLFDIVAGTSSGAMNGAILVSHVIDKGTWEGSVEKLKAFWDYVSTEPDLRYWYPYILNKKDWVAYWDNQRKINPNIATGEAARRYYSLSNFYVQVFLMYIYQSFQLLVYHSMDFLQQMRGSLITLVF